MLSRISPRQETLLTSIIEEYVQTAEPVSSKLLEKTGFFGLKSATIRAAMNELEDIGYLTHRHTSGGRVPTDKAYRYFVDNLLTEKRKVKSGKERRIIKEAIWGAGDEPREINKTVAQLLSDLSGDLVITGILEEDDFFKVGLSSLFEMPEFREFNKTFRLTSFFDEFEDLFAKLEENFFGGSVADELKVFIGRENPVREIRDETVMFAKYNLPRNHTGSMTLVGPTRMDYEKNIGLIKYATEELNRLARRT